MGLVKVGSEKSAPKSYENVPHDIEFRCKVKTSGDSDTRFAYDFKKNTNCHMSQRLKVCLLIFKMHPCQNLISGFELVFSKSLEPCIQGYTGNPEKKWWIFTPEKG